MINMPIGKPWDMIAVDILQVPISSQNNKYLLVVQDYFTKWVEVIPLPDPTAKRVTRELVQVFTKYGLPIALHSDQGRNFESAMLQQTLDAFGIRKSRTTAYHPEGDGMVERLNACSYSCYAHTQRLTMNGSTIYHLYCLHTAQQCTLQLEFLHLH